MSKKVAVIFDMDGVICHTNPYHSLAFREFFSTRDLSPSDEEFAQHMFGKSNSYILSHFFKRPIAGEELLQLEQEKEGLFRKIYAPHITPISGLVEFVRNLNSHDIQLGVATSAPRANLDLIMGELQLHQHFGSMLASEDVSLHKPHPEVYLSSAMNLGVAPEQCLVFEDSFSGITAALNAGMQVAAVLSTHTREELPPCAFYIDDYTGLTYDKIKSFI